MTGTEKTETIYGKEYRFRKLPPRQWVRLKDRCKNRFGVVQEEDFMSEVLEHLVVDPVVTLDDFEDWDEAEAVVTAAVRFQLGKAIPK
ncbi:MAG: hypothetical protein JRD89_02755 [Deltaproteobacteria bacterium]|nr:hypothetical protein [Deltaproteobacteria bacterium]